METIDPPIVARAYPEGGGATMTKLAYFQSRKLMILLQNVMSWVCFKSIDKNAKKFSTGLLSLILRNRKQYGITREKCQHQKKTEKLVLQLQH